MNIPIQEALKKAAEYTEKGEQLDVASSLLHQALDSSYHHASIDKGAVLFLLGNLHWKMQCKQAAIMYYRLAVQHKEHFIEAQNNIACILKGEGFKEEARDEFKKVIDLFEILKDKLSDKDKAEFLTNYASCFVQNGTPDEAIKIIDRALKLNDENKDLMLWNRSLALLEKGDFEQGFKDYDWGDRSRRQSNRKYSENETPVWDGTKDKVVVVFGEQGIGDELMFASILPDLIRDCKQVIVDAHLRLQDIFRASFPEVIVYGSREQDLVPWHKYHQIDYKIQMGSLTRFYRKKESDFPGVPYLVPSCDLSNKRFDAFKAIPQDKPLIGFSWRGGAKSTCGGRKIPLELWKPIFELDANFISLQYEPEAEQKIKKFCEKNNIHNVHHWQNIIDDYDLTSALLPNLDLIITVPQSVVNLAGGLGVMTWQLCPVTAMWQIGVYKKNSPWYQCVHNIWQERAGDWEPVMKTVKEKLCSLLSMSTDLLATTTA